MPLWIAWLKEHWFSALLLAGIGIAVLYVIVNREQLFYKE